MNSENVTSYKKSKSNKIVGKLNFLSFRRMFSIGMYFWSSPISWRFLAIQLWPCAVEVPNLQPAQAGRLATNVTRLHHCRRTPAHQRMSPKGFNEGHQRKIEGGDRVAWIHSWAFWSVPRAIVRGDKENLQDLERIALKRTPLSNASRSFCYRNFCCLFILFPFYSVINAICNAIRDRKTRMS